MVQKASAVELYGYGDSRDASARKELIRDAGMGMKVLDRILELLHDERAHSLDEIRAHIPLSAEKLALILDFLAKFEFIELLGEHTEARITLFGLSFLDLPGETLSD
jgi:hypothetical protein